MRAGLASVAAGVAGLTLAARLVGFGRSLVFSKTVGDTCLGDTYNAANSLPNVLFEIVAGGVLAGVVVPVVARHVGAGRDEHASRTASALITWTLLVLTPAGLAVLAGAGMWWFGWRWLDPLTALLVGVVVAVSAFALLRDSFNAAMDAVPRQIDQAQVHAFLASCPGVTAVHHVHIWSLGAGEIAMTAHLVRATADDHDVFIDGVTHDLDERFGINHPTLQIEFGAACEHDAHDPAPHH